MCILFAEPEEEGAGGEYGRGGGGRAECGSDETPSGGGERHFLLLHRALNWRGWEFVKGGIDAGENVEDAGMREIKEEVGVESVQLQKKLKQKHKWLAEGVHYDYEVLLFSADMGEKVKLQTSPVKEHDKYEWVPQARARARLHYENAKKVFDLALGEI